MCRTEFRRGGATDPESRHRAEMGKLMVAEGLGATVLPDFSVVGDLPPLFVNNARVYQTP